MTFNPTAIGSRTATLLIPNNVGSKTLACRSRAPAPARPSWSPPNPVEPSGRSTEHDEEQTSACGTPGTIAFKVTRRPSPADTTAPTDPGGQACIGTTLAPGKSCNITVNLRPTAARFYSATLEVTGDASSLPATVKTSLTGTGK